MLHTRVSAVHSETKENERQIKLLQEGQEKAKKDLSTLFRHISEFRKEMEELSEKVSELYVVKKLLAVFSTWFPFMNIAFRQIYMITGTKAICRWTTLGFHKI